MKTMINAFLTIALLAMVVTVPAMAQNDTRVTYIHTDADGTPFAATDEQGNLEWQIEHLPFGGEHSNTEVRRNNNLSFAGKIYDKDIGLSYFGGRWYDPASGRFTGIDPMPVNAEDWKTFNRYAYGNNNPYKYVDPDGNLPFLIPIAIFLAKEGLAEVASRYTGGATDLLSVRRMGSKLLKKSLQLLKRNKCFVAGTPVHTKEGLKSIEDIQIGDLVASKNDETGEIDFKPVTELFVNKDKQVLNITFVDNNQQQELIGTTAEHPFWVEGKGWTEAGDLNIGDKVTTLEGGVLSVQAMASDAQLQTTYNFEVEEFHTYFVGKRALWVHNSCGGEVPKNGGEVKYHYTTADETSFSSGLWKDTSVTDKLYTSATEAGQKLGIPTPNKVIPIKDSGNFVPNKPSVVQPSNRYQGGGTDFVNPQRVSPDDILPAQPIN
ncbi:MAG: polymorphic toxin-type HINT domain-containing protein [Arenicella sp.]